MNQWFYFGNETRRPQHFTPYLPKPGPNARLFPEGDSWVKLSDATAAPLFNRCLDLQTEFSSVSTGAAMFQQNHCY